VGNQTVGQVLGAHGTPLAVEWQGRKYHAGHFTQRRKTAWENWLVGRVMAPALALAEQNPEAAWATKALEVVADRAAAGRYGFYSLASRQAMSTEEGQLAFTAIAFGVPEEEMLDLMRGKPAEVGAVMRIVLRQSFPDAKIPEPEPAPAEGGGSGPNAPAPGA